MSRPGPRVSTRYSTLSGVTHDIVEGVHELRLFRHGGVEMCWSTRRRGLSVELELTDSVFERVGESGSRDGHANWRYVIESD